MVLFKKGNVGPISEERCYGAVNAKTRQKPAAIRIRSVPNPLTKNIEPSSTPNHTPADKK